MQPAAKDPSELLVVLDPESGGRRQLATLVQDACRQMRARLRPREDAPARVVECCVAATRAFDGWRDDFFKKLRAVLAQRDNNDIAVARERRRQQQQQQQQQQEAINRKPTTSAYQDLLSLDDQSPDDNGISSTSNDTVPADSNRPAESSSYSPIPTPLLLRPLTDRTAILSCLLLLLLSTGAYSAHSRVLLRHVSASLALPLAVLVAEETAVAATLIETATSNAMTADAEAAQRKQQNQVSRVWKVGLASVAGAAVIGITGGLAAPVVAGAIGSIMGGVGLGGVASFLGMFWMNGALVGTLFGAFGAKMTGERMDRYAREVEDFAFVPLAKSTDKKVHRLRLTVGVNGCLLDHHDVTRPWRVLSTTTEEVFGLRYELAALMELGTSLKSFVSSYAWGAARNELLRRTVLASVWGAVWPAAILSGVASAIDNPFAHALNRSLRAGQILADALANRVQGERPVTLVSVSLGAALVCSCLEELARRRVFGVVEDVVIIGAPAGSGADYWAALETVVSGRIFNVYSDRDAILGFLFRAHGLTVGVAGLQKVGGPVVENLDVSAEVDGHLKYPAMLPSILARCSFPDIVVPAPDTSADTTTAAEQQPSLIDFGVPDEAVSNKENDAPESQPNEEARVDAAMAKHASRTARNSIQQDPMRPSARTATSADAILGIGSISLDDDDSFRPPPLERIHSSFDYVHDGVFEHDSDDEHGHARIKMVDNDKSD